MLKLKTTENIEIAYVIIIMIFLSAHFVFPNPSPPS